MVTFDDGMVNAAINASEPKNRRRRGKTQFRGIVKDASKLGVTYTHLWRVLIGERQSPTLLARYATLHRSKRHSCLRRTQEQSPRPAPHN